MQKPLRCHRFEPAVRTAFLFAALLTAASCGSAASGPPTFDNQLESFIVSVCKYSTCGKPQSYGACERDVRMDMADAKAQLDEAGEASCAQCMATKISVFQTLIEPTCKTLTTEDQTRIKTHCGPHGDDVCAGFP